MPIIYDFVLLYLVFLIGLAICYLLLDLYYSYCNDKFKLEILSSSKIFIEAKFSVEILSLNSHRITFLSFLFHKGGKEKEFNKHFSSIVVDKIIRSSITLSSLSLFMNIRGVFENNLKINSFCNSFLKSV